MSINTRHHFEFTNTDLYSALNVWYQSPVGRLLLTEIRAQLDVMLPRLFGYYALQVGDLAASIDLMASSRIKQRFCLDMNPGSVDLLAKADELPFQQDSLDLILLMHSLDFAEDPHRVLREVDRTLIPEGHVVIVGFNPMSLFGLWKITPGHKNRVPWCGCFYRCSRLKDWLSLLGFKALASNNLGFRPPIQHMGLQHRLEFLERVGVRYLPYFGSIHVILAQKKVATLTPIKPRWRSRKSLLAGNLTEPSARELCP
jgi:SAM-dependent methyltransferase